MTEEWPDALNTKAEYEEWIEILANNVSDNAIGNAVDAAETGDNADTPESRLEYEAELEVDDKIAFAADRSPRLFYDIVRLSKNHLRYPESLSWDDEPQRLIENISFDVLQQDVEQRAQELLQKESP